MKLDAYIDIIDSETNNFLDTATVPIDADYVEDNVEDVNEWIENSDIWHEISKTWNQDGKTVEFEVTNMTAILEDLKFDEFQQKTT